MNISSKIAWMLPKSIVYYCGIRIWAHGTTGIYSKSIMSEMNMNELMNRWDQSKRSGING